MRAPNSRPTRPEASTKRPGVGRPPKHADAADGRPTAPDPSRNLLGKTALQDVVGGATKDESAPRDPGVHRKKGNPRLIGESDNPEHVIHNTREA